MQRGASAFRRPHNTRQFWRQLRRVGWIKQIPIQRFTGLQFLLWSPDNQPKHFGFSIIEYLTQDFGADQQSAVLRHGEGLVRHSNSSHAFHYKIKLLHQRVAVKRVGAFGRKTPEPGAHDLAAGSFQKIRVGNFHYIGKPPGEVLGRNQKITINGFHCVTR